MILLHMMNTGLRPFFGNANHAHCCSYLVIGILDIGKYIQYMEDFCRCVRFKGINVPSLWHEYNSWLKPNHCYDYFYNNIPTSQLKPCHFDPTLSDGNIEQVYGKLRPRAVHHTSVMASAFKIGVWVWVGESFMGSLTEKVKGYLTLDSFLSKGNVTDWLQAGPEKSWSMILPDLTLFPGCLGHCFSGILQSWLFSTSQVCKCVYVRKRASKGVWLFMTQWGDLAVNLHTHGHAYYLYRLDISTFKEVLFYQASPVG